MTKYAFWLLFKVNFFYFHTQMVLWFIDFFFLLSALVIFLKKASAERVSLGFTIWEIVKKKKKKLFFFFFSNTFLCIVLFFVCFFFPSQSFFIHGPFKIFFISGYIAFTINKKKSLPPWHWSFKPIDLACLFFTPFLPYK